MDPSCGNFQPPAGTRAGAYELVKVLGRGAFGLVYLGRGDNGNEVAVKLLRGECGHNHDVFTKEVEGLKKACNAPPEARVVRLVEAWQDAALGGCYCLATTPLCAGGSLEDMIDKKCMLPELATRLRWALEVAETLQLLHSTHGVRLYHGDVSPRNVAFRMDHSGWREAFVLDLGVALHNHPYGMTDRLKQWGTSVAPETEDDTYEFDESADVWSWGVLLYALLSWSLARMGLAPERAWFASLPMQDRSLWEHELSGPTDCMTHWGETKGEATEEQAVPPIQWQQVLKLMVDCLRKREERVGMETVVHVMRRVLGYQEAPCRLVWLEQQLREGSRQALDQRDEAKLLLEKAGVHNILQQHVHQRVCLELAVSISRAHYGQVGDPQQLIQSVTALATMYTNKGEYDRALPLCEEALAMRRILLPPQHPDIATSLNHLASPLNSKGEYDRALPLYEEALVIRRAALAPQHPDIANSLNNLASLYKNKGDYKRALPLFEEALAIRRAALSPTHPDTAASLSNLASLYHSKRAYDRAQPLFEEALMILRAALPPQHPHIAVSLNNLASLHKSKEEYEEALPLCEEALAIRRAVLPPQHPHIAASLNSLGGLHEMEGEYDQALPLYEEALAILRAGLPPKHPDIAIPLKNLVRLHMSEGEYDRALPLFEEALAIRRAALLAEHPDIVASLNNLASLFKSKRAYPQAVRMYEEALAVRRETLPFQHPDIVDALNNLAGLHKSEGEYYRALPLFEEALAIRRATLPHEHPDIISSLQKLVRLHEMKGEYDRALPLYEEVLAIRRAMGIEQPDSAT